MIKKIKTSIVLYLVLITFFSLGLAYHLKRDEVFFSADGEHCYYENFEGVCYITSVVRQSESARIFTGSDFNITFTFKPERINSNGNILNKDGFNFYKEQQIKISNHLVRKFDVNRNDAFRCTMRKNSFGSCEPILFEFLWSEKIIAE